jgi:magnesium transporter
MGKKKKQKAHNVGAPPGELYYTGEAKEERVRLTLIEYNEKDFLEGEFYSTQDLFRAVRPGYVKWINVDGIHRLDLIEQIGKQYNIHPLTLEDIVHVESRPKFEDYDHYVVTIMKMLYYDTHVHSEHLSIVLFEDMVISFQEPHGGDAFDIIRTRLRQGKGRVRKMQADYLAYALIDAVVDTYFIILDKVGEKVSALDEEIMDASHQSASTRLHDLKREVIFLRKQLAPAREMINNIVRNETDLIKETNDAYLRDLQDHIVRALDTVETYRETLGGITDVFMNNNTYKMNEAVKALTVISSIFIPVTFIAGVYGMNFKYMPEIESPYGYWITWGVMLTIMIGMGIYFKRKNWW